MYTYTHLQRADLFEGVHLGGEVGGFEHAQQRVEPQVVHHGDEFPLEPHAQQLDGRQQVRDAHQTLKGDTRGATAWARHESNKMQYIKEMDISQCRLLDQVIFFQG